MGQQQSKQKTLKHTTPSKIPLLPEDVLIQIFKFVDGQIKPELHQVHPRWKMIAEKYCNQVGHIDLDDVILPYCQKGRPRQANYSLGARLLRLHNFIERRADTITSFKYTGCNLGGIQQSDISSIGRIIDFIMTSSVNIRTINYVHSKEITVESGMFDLSAMYHPFKRCGQLENVYFSIMHPNNIPTVGLRRLELRDIKPGMCCSRLFADNVVPHLVELIFVDVELHDLDNDYYTIEPYLEIAFLVLQELRLVRCSIIPRCKFYIGDCIPLTNVEAEKDNANAIEVIRSVLPVTHSKYGVLNLLSVDANPDDVVFGGYASFSGTQRLVHDEQCLAEFTLDDSDDYYEEIE